MKPLFGTYIGVDYSGAAKPATRLSAIRVYKATKGEPKEQRDERKKKGVVIQQHWSRQALSEWLSKELEKSNKENRVIIGIDHGFSYPLEYFKCFGKSDIKTWDCFLADFRKYWPTDQRGQTVQAILDEIRDRRRVDRLGKTDWFRLTERWTSSAKSVFQFNGQGQVGKFTHAGIPWLAQLREKFRNKVHFWPFDGWEVGGTKSVIAEVYPSLWSGRFDQNNRNQHQHDAYSVAAWLKRSDENNTLRHYFNPPLTEEERTIAGLEGWILGVL